MFDCMCNNSSLLVKLEDEQPGKLLVIAFIPSKKLRNLVDLISASVYAAVQGSHSSSKGFAASSPADNEFLIAITKRCHSGLHHALRQDDECDLANHRYASPRHRGSPESGQVCDLSRDCRQMWMCGREEIECDLGRKYILRKRRSQQSWEAFVEKFYGYRNVSACLEPPMAKSCTDSFPALMIVRLSVRSL